MSSVPLQRPPWLHRALRTPTALVLIGLCATLLGYRAGLNNAGPPSMLRLGDLPDASEFTRCDTFSEIGMLHSRLRGLCQRTLHEFNLATLRQRDLASVRSHGPGDRLGPLADLVTEVRQTPEEEPALRILLFRLSRAGAHQRWLDLYVDFTQRNPMASLVSDLRAEAGAVARACGREAELAHLGRLLDQWRGSPAGTPPSP